VASSAQSPNAAAASAAGRAGDGETQRRTSIGRPRAASTRTTTIFGDQNPAARLVEYPTSRSRTSAPTATDASLRAPTSLTATSGATRGPVGQHGRRGSWQDPSAQRSRSLSNRAQMPNVIPMERPQTRQALVPGHGSPAPVAEDLRP
jgi:hypothetical protein